MALTTDEQRQRNAVLAYSDKFVRAIRGEVTDLPLAIQSQVAAVESGSASSGLITTSSALGKQALAELRSANSSTLTDAQKAQVANLRGYGRDWYAVSVLSSPSVTTAAITSISAAAAVSGGDVTNSGGSTITARGVCWSTVSGPTLADSRTTDAGTTGAFVSVLSGLSPSTTYFVRAYATNAIGTSYGAQQTFTTSAASTGNHAHFNDMQSHPSHHFSASLRTAESVNSNVSFGLTANKAVDATEDALRFKIWAGARDVLQSGEGADVILNPPIVPTVGSIISIQWEQKFANTGCAGIKMFNWRTNSGSITWETNIEPDVPLDNDTEHAAGLYESAISSAPQRKPYRVPGYSSIRFRLYQPGVLTAPFHGYPGNTNPDTVLSGDANGINYNPGGQVAYYGGDSSHVLAPSQHYGQSKTAVGGTQPFIFKVGIWYRFTQSMKYMGDNNWQIWCWVSSEEDDPVRLLADRDNPANGYPVYGWNITQVVTLFIEFNESAWVAGQDQYTWTRNVIAFDGDHVPLGGRPNGSSRPWVLPTSIVKTARGVANFGSVTSFNVSFAGRTTAAAAVIDSAHWLVIVVTVENAANRTITITDNGSNAWQVIQQTPTNQSRRCIIARTSASNGSPTRATVTIDSATAGMCYATLYEVENATTVDSDAIQTTSATTHGGMSVQTTKQGLLFGGFVGSSGDQAGYATARVPVLSITSQTRFTVAAGLFASDIGANRLVVSIFYSTEQWQIIPVVSYNNTTGEVVLEYPSRNPDNTLRVTTSTLSFIYRPKWVDPIEIDVSPKNWDLFWPTNQATEGWSGVAPNHVHGVRGVFQAGSWDFPIKSSSAEDASSVIVSME